MRLEGTGLDNSLHSPVCVNVYIIQCYVEKKPLNEIWNEGNISANVG